MYPNSASSYVSYGPIVRSRIESCIKRKKEKGNQQYIGIQHPQIIKELNHRTKKLKSSPPTVLLRLNKDIKTMKSVFIIYKLEKWLLFFFQHSPEITTLVAGCQNHCSLSNCGEIKFPIYQNRK